MPRKRILFPNILISLLFLLSVFTTVAPALEVSPDSPCASKCLRNPDTDDASDPKKSATFNKDLACANEEFAGDKRTEAGRKFKECLECQQKSGYEDRKTGERDTGWFLFNNRAVIDWCIFGRFADEKRDNVRDTVVYKECNSACNPIYSAADFNVKSDPAAYGFCDHEGNFTTDSAACAKCLYDLPRFTILGNILTTAVEMCKQKPGKVFSFDADIYTATRISLSSTTLTASGSATSDPTSSDTSTSTSAPDSPSHDDAKDLSAGATAGIVIGSVSGMALLLGIAALVLCRRRNKNKLIRMPSHDQDNDSEAGSQMMMMTRDEHHQHSSSAPPSQYARSSMVESTYKQQYAAQQPEYELDGAAPMAMNRGYHAVSTEGPVELGDGEVRVAPAELPSRALSPLELR